MSDELTLLLVDGHQSVREALAQRLQRVANVRAVVAVTNAALAADLVCTIAPDVIIYDPRTVPDHNDRSLQRLRQCGVPLVILTSSVRDDEAAHFRQQGAAAVFLKGNSVRQLTAQIAAIAASTQQTRPTLAIGG